MLLPSYRNSAPAAAVVCCFPRKMLAELRPAVAAVLASVHSKPHILLHAGHTHEQATSQQHAKMLVVALTKHYLQRPCRGVPVSVAVRHNDQPQDVEGEVGAIPCVGSTRARARWRPVPCQFLWFTWDFITSETTQINLTIPCAELAGRTMQMLVML